MPNLNGTGPQGEGSKTGRGMGNCVGENKAQSVARPQRVGRGAGRGLGRANRGQGLGRNN